MWRGTFRDWVIKTKYQGIRTAGECETVEPLISCKILDSGHMMPMDQPETSLQMVQNFIAKKPFDGPRPTLSPFDAGKDIDFTPVTPFAFS